jgi:hypothetical protein
VYAAEDEAQEHLLQTMVEVYVPPGAATCSLNHLSTPAAVNERSTSTIPTEASNPHIRKLVSLLEQSLAAHLPSDDSWALAMLEVRDPRLVIEATRVVGMQAAVMVAYQHSCDGMPCSDAIPTGWYQVQSTLADGTLHTALLDGVSIDQAVAEGSLPDESHQGDNLITNRSSFMMWPSFWVAIGLVVLVALGAILTVRRRQRNTMDSYTPMEFSNPSFGLTPTTPSP